MYEYIYHVSLFLVGAIAFASVFGMGSEIRAERKRQDQQTPDP